MSLTERSERVLAEVDAGRMTHNVQIELIALVRAYHAQAIAPAEDGPLAIVAPNKDDHDAEAE